MKLIRVKKEMATDVKYMKTDTNWSTEEGGLSAV